MPIPIDYVADCARRSIVIAQSRQVLADTASTMVNLAQSLQDCIRTPNVSVEYLQRQVSESSDTWQALARIASLADQPVSTQEELAERLVLNSAIQPTELYNNMRDSLAAAIEVYGDRVGFSDAEEHAPGTIGATSHPRVYLRVDGVELEDPEEGGNYYLGNFYVTVVFEPQRVYTLIFPENRDYMSGDNSSVCHPHVSDNSPCWGNLYDSVSLAEKYGLVYEIFQLGESLLRSYNPDGPFVSLHNWGNSNAEDSGGPPRCKVCGDFMEGQETVITNAGDRIHRHCAEYCKSRSCWIEVGTSARCPNCQTLVPQQELANQYGVCGGCLPKLEEETTAAQSGAFICPYCRTRYEGSDIDANRLELGEKVVVCRHCHTLDDQTVRCTHGDPAASPINGVNLSTIDYTLYARRPIIPIARLVSCDCGASVGESMIRRCTVTGERICPSCDPEGLNVSPAVMQDVALLDACFTMWLQPRLQPIDREYLRFASLYEMSLDDAQHLVRAALRAPNFSVPSDTLFIADKVQMWNQLANLAFVTSVNGYQHDQEIVSHWQLSGERGRQLLEQNRDRIQQQQQSQPHAAEETAEGTPHVRVTPV